MHNEDATDVSSVRCCVRRFNGGEKYAGDRLRSDKHTASYTKVKKVLIIKKTLWGKNLNFVNCDNYRFHYLMFTGPCIIVIVERLKKTN